MNYSHSFEKCYQILNIQTDCDWNAVKKSYRKLIQKWHPDRQADPKEKLEATNKLKDLNTAFTQLSNYYQEHGELPLKKQPEQAKTLLNLETNKPENNTIKEASAPKKPENHKRNPHTYEVNKKSYKSRFLTSIVAVTVLVIIYQNIDVALEQIERDIDSPDYHHKVKNNKHGVFKKSQKEQFPIEKNKIVKEKYFSYGSSISEVISIQGPPDRTKGNIWYYGNSEIHFTEGKVSYWFRSADRPLKAIMMKPKHSKITTQKNQILQF